MATMEAKKDASCKWSSLEKTRKIHVLPTRISLVELHDRASVGRYDYSVVFLFC